MKINKIKIIQLAIFLLVLLVEVTILELTPFKNFDLIIQRLLIIFISIITWEVVKKISNNTKKDI